jgi:hypothetical protein
MRTLTIFAITVGLACVGYGCESKPEQTPAPAVDAGKKYGGQHIDEAKKARDLLKSRRDRLGDEVEGSGGKAP